MSTVDIKYFNLLVHYGIEFKNNFNQLLDEALLDVFQNPQYNSVTTTQTMKIHQVKYFEIKEQILITGLLYKSGEVKWEHIPDENEEPIFQPGTKRVMPYARFILSVADHRLFWITKRGLTKSPSVSDFCFFLKKKTLPILKEKYRLEAEIEWEVIKEDSKSLGFKNKSHFINTYFKENKLTSKLFEVRAVAEVSQEAVAAIIDDKKYIIKSASFFPHMNNVTDDDCTELFTTADKIAKEAESEATINLKPKSSEDGIKKETVKEILNINQNHHLLKFSLSLKNVSDKMERPLVVSNVKDADTIIAKTGAAEGEAIERAIIPTLVTKFPEIVGQEELDSEIKDKIQGSGIEKINVE